MEYIKDTSNIKEIENIINMFLKHMRKKGYSQNTITAYGCAVKQFFRQYEEITIENLERYRAYLIHTYQANSVNLKVSAINHFLKYISIQEITIGDTSDTSVSECEWNGYILQTVVIQKASFLDNVISQEDYEKLKENLKRDNQEFWHFLIRYMAGTGARVSEVVQIKAEHVMKGYIDLYSKGGKIRRIFFPESLTEETKLWLDKKNQKTGFLFLNRQGKRITPRGINSQLKKFAVRYGIDSNTVYAHSFRHLFAKNFLRKMNDIALLADLMGHESIETTRVYLKKSSTEQRKLIDEMITW